MKNGKLQNEIIHGTGNSRSPLSGYGIMGRISVEGAGKLPAVSTREGTLSHWAVTRPRLLTCDNFDLYGSLAL